ncbi:uncharacterized protein DC041_0001074 [Schistosoma bovis]|uniref:Uncharacterized protein n=1 Tax=Schistosoma bovis TaxID=6184 RepID=A0A430QLR0_SCHBO|nr:uncharacterized protein DC041_0001074 [Schistosoma bovis]
MLSGNRQYGNEMFYSELPLLRNYLHAFSYWMLIGCCEASNNMLLNLVIIVSINYLR